MPKEKKAATEDAKRNTFFIKNQTSHGLKYIALMQQRSQTEILEEALQRYIADYEKKNGRIPTAG